MATPLASILPPGKTQFFNGNGVPLAGGTINFYVPNTTTPKTTWQDALESVPNSNPVILDASGMALIYGSGQYRMIVKDSLGNLIYDALTQDAISLQSASTVFGGTSTGSANAQTITVSSIAALTVGQQIPFIAGFTNTGAMTLRVNFSSGNSGAINVFRQSLAGPVALSENEVQTSQMVIVDYDGTEFQIVGMISGLAALNLAQSFTAAQRAMPSPITFATVMTPDFSLSNNFSVGMSGNATLANPTNQVSGQAGQFVLTQDSTGNRTLAYGTNWKFSGGTAPTLTTNANAVDILSYYAEDGMRISASLLPNTR